MSQTLEERVGYWKARIMDQLVSTIKQMQIDFKSIRDNVAHVPLEDGEIQKALTGIDKSVSELAKAISNAKVKTNKKEASHEAEKTEKVIAGGAKENEKPVETH